jgi:aspartyl protease family protein
MNRLHILVIVASLSGVVYVANMPAPAPQLAVSAEPAKRFYSSPNVWSKDEMLVARDEGRWRGEVRLERQGNGHFYTQAVVKGTPVRAVVDTGATVVALTGDDARRIGLTWTPGEIEPVAKGASGTVMGLVRRVDSIAVGGIVVRDLEVMIIPEGLEITLLGQNFLSRVTSVEMRGSEMVLSNL